MMLKEKKLDYQRSCEEYIEQKKLYETFEEMMDRMEREGAEGGGGGDDDMPLMPSEMAPGRPAARASSQVLCFY